MNNQPDLIFRWLFGEGYLTAVNRSSKDLKQRGSYKASRRRSQRQKLKAHNKRQARMNPRHGKRGKSK